MSGLGVCVCDSSALSICWSPRDSEGRKSSAVDATQMSSAWQTAAQVAMFSTPTRVLRASSRPLVLVLGLNRRWRRVFDRSERCHPRAADQSFDVGPVGPEIYEKCITRMGSEAAMMFPQLIAKTAHFLPCIGTLYGQVTRFPVAVSSSHAAFMQFILIRSQR